MASKNGRVPETYEPGDLNFHYNREERESMLSEDTKKILQKSKLFTINRRNMIILADIAIIIVFVMIFVPIIMVGKSNAKIQGFRSNLRAYEYDGKVLTRVKIEAGEDNPQESRLVKVSFNAKGLEEPVEVIDLLPSEKDKPRVLRAEFQSEDISGERIEAEVEIEDKKRKLSVKIKQE